MIKKLASTKHPTAMELQRKLASRKSDVEPYFNTRIQSNCCPNKELVKPLQVRAPNTKTMIMAMVALSSVANRVLLKLCTANMAILSSPCTKNENYE